MQLLLGLHVVDNYGFLLLMIARPVLSGVPETDQDFENLPHAGSRASHQLDELPMSSSLVRP